MKPLLLGFFLLGCAMSVTRSNERIVVDQPMPSNDPITYWWRTDDAAVISLHRPIRECSLLLYNKTQSVIITWNKQDRNIQLQSVGWRFTDGQTVPVLLQIGDQTFTSTATAKNDYLVMPISAPIQSDLTHAGHVILSYLNGGMVDSGFNVTIDPSHMPKLLEAVERCRHML